MPNGQTGLPPVILYAWSSSGGALYAIGTDVKNTVQKIKNKSRLLDFPIERFLYLGLIPSSCQVRGLYSAGLLAHKRVQLSILIQFVQGLGEVKALHAQGHSNSHESLQVQLSQEKQHILCGTKWIGNIKVVWKGNVSWVCWTAPGSEERVAASSVF